MIFRLPLETSRLILRPFTLGDVERFQSYRNDAQTAAYQGWEIPFSLERAREFIEGMIAAEPGQPGGWYQIAVVRKDSGDLIGDCAFVLLAEEPRQAEIAFTLARDQRGQGYGVEAVRCLIDRLFESDANLHRIRGNCDPRNHSSGRLMQRVGMRHEGRWIDSLWFKGGWVSEDWYAILRSEWATGKPASFED